MQIQKLVFNAGSAENSQQLFFAPGRVTVLVGPNNGGKSATLREIHQSVTLGRDVGIILAEITHSIPELEDLDALVERFVFRNLVPTNPGHDLFGFRGTRQEVQRDTTRSHLSNRVGGRPSQYAYAMLLQHVVLTLGGENRLGMVQGGRAQSLREEPHSTIAAICEDNALRKKICNIGNEAFGQHVPKRSAGIQSVTRRLPEIEY